MDDDPVLALALAVVTDVAPLELPLFAPISRAWRANPDRVQRGRGTDKVLGFGVAETAILVTPVILSIAKQFAAALTEDLTKSLANAAANQIADRIKHLFHRQAPLIALSQGQVERLRNIALVAAREHALPEPEADKLAAAIIAKLAEQAAPE